MRYVPVFLIIFIFIFQGYVFFKDKNTTVKNSYTPGQYVKLGSETFSLEIADNDVLRSKGLSSRDSICNRCAMLFVFEKEGDYRLWMKDMNFSIDMVWLDKNKRIIYRKENVSPSTFPETFGPNDNKTLYIIELPAGTFEKLNLDIGQEIFF